MAKNASLPDVRGLELADAKQLIRTFIRDRRSKRAKSQLAEFGDLWARTVVDFADDAEVVAAYVSTAHEPPTHPALDALAAAGKRILLPKLGPGLSRDWAWYAGADDLEQNAPGRPPSPSGESLGADAIVQAQAIIIPGLAINYRGDRLGQGGGWYDRMLKLDVNSARVGAMVFPDELVDEPLPHDDMDVPVRWALLPDGPVEVG